MTTKVLIIEDDGALRQSIVQTLQLEELEPIPTTSFTQARRTIRSNFNGVILSDIKMPDHDGFDVLRFAQSIDTDLPVVMLTAHSDVPTAMRAMREGAYDYLEKPCETAQLIDTLRRALDHRALVLRNRQMARQLERGDAAATHFPGESAVSKTFRDTLRAAAESDGPIHFYGAPVIGKRTAAFVIHALSARGDRFEAINLEDALPTDLGRLDQSTALTLSAKNVHLAADLTLAALSELMKGKADIRLITTATQTLDELGLSFGGLDPLHIYVPSLEERAEDVPSIFEGLLRQTVRSAGLHMPVVPDQISDRLSDKNWDGDLDDLRALVDALVAQIEPASGISLTERVEDYEKRVITEALLAANGSVANAAEALRIPRNTLYDRMSRFGLVARDYRRGTSR